MAFGILHLTDLHFSEKTNLDDKFSSLVKVVVDEFRDIERIYIVVSGDIANSGKKSEYTQAKYFFDEIQKAVYETLNLTTKFIIVPGNHDCNFNNDNQLRINSIRELDYNTLGEDDSVVNLCLSIQDEFWEFYSHYNPIPKNKLSYTVTDSIGEHVVCFHCHNTAWMSQLEEKTGTLFFPVKRFMDKFDEGNQNINISVFHHPASWLSPNTETNNKREFQKYLDKISSVHIIGHEHEMSLEMRHDLDIDKSALHFSGAILNSNKQSKKSGFQVLKFNELTQKGLLRRYDWKEELYTIGVEKDFKYNGVENRTFFIDEEFARQIIEINLPLVGNNGKDRLPDIFVYPDLESLGEEQKKISDHIDSKSLIGNSTITHCLLEGESQVGKTSLLRMYFLEYHDRGYYPLIIDGKDIVTQNFDKVVKETFLKTYKSDSVDYDKYKQLDASRKVLLIDNFQDNELNTKNAQKFIAYASANYSYVNASIDTVHSMLPNMHTEFSDFKYLKIKPLGYKKTNDLILKYHTLQGKLKAPENQVLIVKTRRTFDQVRNIMGDKILPSYPIFILSILQSLENASLDLKETSYGYCYQSLIHLALVGKAGVTNDDLGAYINFLTELAFFFHTNEHESLTESKFLAFYNNYSIKFIIPAYDIVKRSLLDSKILKYCDSSYEFGYVYILYFLVAKYISEIVDSGEGKRLLAKLFDDLHLEKNAKILVFVTHHTKDISFIHDSLFNVMVPFEKVEPITLEKGGSFYKHIKDITDEISHNIIEGNRVPEEEIERRLIAQDNAERSLETKTEEKKSVQNEVYDSTFPFIQAFRSIEIVGQIVKNRKGSLEKTELIDLISEVYLTGFRTVGHLGTVFDEAKLDLTEELKNRITDKEDRDKIEKKISTFFRMIGYDTCFGVFSKLVHSVGLKDLNELYDDVADKIGSPAAKLVTFSINSYYNDLSMKDLISLEKEFKNNYVAMYILKSRVKSHIYNNHVDFRKKQQIAQLLEMTIV